MTGTEAISNGVSAFKQPSAKNAATTLGWMAAILAVFFLGVSSLARHFGVMPSASETVLSQLARHVFGGGLVYYVFQYATFAILVLAANTAFADFPRLVEHSRARSASCRASSRRAAIDWRSRTASSRSPSSPRC